MFKANDKTQWITKAAARDRDTFLKFLELIADEKTLLNVCNYVAGLTEPNFTPALIDKLTEMQSPALKIYDKFNIKTIY